MLVAPLCLFVTSQTIAHQASLFGELSGKNTGLGSHSLLQRIFPTLGLNLGLLHCRQILYHLSHQGSPNNAVIYSIDIYMYIYIHMCVT